MDNEFIQSLKNNLDIVDIIGSYITLQRSGGSYKACCPFHKEKTPSFIVNEQRQYYKCFGCGKSGDVISFVQDIEKLEFMDAVRILAEKAGMQIPLNEGYGNTNRNMKQLKEINLYAARYYYKELIHNKTALEYLKNRRILPKTIQTFGLGYTGMTHDLKAQLLERFEESLLIESGILSMNEKQSRLVFRNRIMFPIFNVRDEIIGFGGRQLDSYGPKYINSKETPLYSKKEHLYALNIAKKHIQNEAIYLVEGYLDAITMYQNGYKNTVATLGTALTVEQAKLLARYAKTVFIMYDTDSAGLKATAKALDAFLDIGLEARVVQLKGAKDPDEFFQTHAATEFENHVLNSKNYLLFHVERLKSEFELHTNTGLDRFTKEAVSFVKQYMKHPFHRQTYVEEAVIRLSQLTGFSIKSIGTEIFGQFFSPRQFVQSARVVNQEKEHLVDLPNEAEDLERKEKIVLDGVLRGKIGIEALSILDFQSKENRILYHRISRGEKPTLDFKLDEIPTDEEYRMLIKNMKNNGLENRIRYFEKLQSEYLGNNAHLSVQNAIRIGNHIIELKKQKG